MENSNNLTTKEQKSERSQIRINQPDGKVICIGQPMIFQKNETNKRHFDKEYIQYERMKTQKLDRIRGPNEIQKKRRKKYGKHRGKKVGIEREIQNHFHHQ